MKLEGAWPDRVLAMQRNWIGRSEGSEIDFKLEGSGEKIRVFTTRVDTIYGATCVILAPEHPRRAEAAGRGGPRARQADDRRARAARARAISIKEGLLPAATRSIRSAATKVPIWIGNFVLMDYGTGAIMAVPGAR